MPVTIELTGLKELAARFDAFPEVYAREVGSTMKEALFILQENVPEYPPAPSNAYQRTGQLGRSLGVNMSGSPQGQADIYEVKRQGNQHGSSVTARFGTRLGYAPRVIGENTQQRPWSGYWWTIKTVATNATSKINETFERLVNDLAAFLDKGK